MKTSFLVLIGATIILSGCTFFSQSKQSGVPTQAGSTETVNQVPERSVENAGSYMQYSESAYQAAQQRGDQVVFFFHAAWCPTCKAANQDITSNLESIPVGVTILKTDYDTENELKEKYGITYQHTFVLVDENGNELKKWNGGGFSQIIENIKN